MTDERLQMWLNFWKWLISTVVVTGGLAWTTALINAKHKDTELQIKINQEEKEYLTSFLEKAMDENLEKRHRFAQYFALVTSSSEYKTGWSKYYEAIDKQVKSAETEKSQLEASLDGISGYELKAAKARIELLENELVSNLDRKPVMRETNSLKDINKLLNYKLNCPDNLSPEIWADLIGGTNVPEIPRALYIKYGCKTSAGKSFGPYVAWYPSGQVISEGVDGGLSTMYYPDGNTAVKIDESVSPRKIEYFNLDGTIRN